MGLDKGKIIRTWRLSLTCVLLFLIGWYYEIPESSWSLVTIWFVMYEYNTVGGVLNKSKLRFWGTLISAVYGIIIIHLCGNDPIINILALIAGLFFYSYWFMGSDKTYTGTIGAVTLTIVLLNYNDIELAILRALNVILGILVSMFMIRFFYPQYARDLLIKMQISWLNQIIEFIKKCSSVEDKDSFLLNDQSYDMEFSFLANLSTYTRLVTEAQMETRHLPFFSSQNRVIQDKFQLLFRLLSTMRFDKGQTAPWFNQQLRLVLNKLKLIKYALIAEELSLTIPAPIEEDSTSNSELNQTQAMNSFLEKLNETVDSLAEAVRQQGVRVTWNDTNEI